MDHVDPPIDQTTYEVPLLVPVNTVLRKGAVPKTTFANGARLLVAHNNKNNTTGIYCDSLSLSIALERVISTASLTKQCRWDVVGMCVPLLPNVFPWIVGWTFFSFFGCLDGPKAIYLQQHDDELTTTSKNQSALFKQFF